MLDVLRFWLDLGIDGFRLDAVPYLYERDGTNGENLPETHEYLRRVRAEVDARYPDRVLLAEANQWPEDVVDYFGDGDECHMCFHFPVMPRMFMALRREDATPIYEILDQTPPIPDNCQWGLFLRNHDELTLEMVTDEERDYMYAEYAKDPRMKLNLGIRRRLAPLLDNGRDEIELMHAILFSLPGSPVLYYGDEIGMGDNVYLGDRDGVRTPMQWTGDRNGGFSRADFAQLYLPPLMDPVYGYQAVNVEAQLRTPTSLLRWLQRFIALRKEHPVFGLGTYEPLRADEPARSSPTSAATRTTSCSASTTSPARRRRSSSTSRRSRAGRPRRCSAARASRAIGELPYLLTLAPRGFFWFQLEESRTSRGGARAGRAVADRVHRPGSAGSAPRRARSRTSRCSTRQRCATEPPPRDRARRGALPDGTHEIYQLLVGVRPAGEGWTSASSRSATAGRSTTRSPTPALTRELRDADAPSSESPAATAPSLPRLEAPRTPTRPRAPDRRRAVEHVGRLRRRARPQGLPPPRGRASTRSSSCCASSPSTASRTSPALAGWYAYAGGRSTRRSASSRSSSPARATAGSSRWTSWRADPDAFLARLRRLGEVTGEHARRARLATPSDPASRPRSRAPSRSALLTATIDEEIEQRLPRPARATTRRSRRSAAAARRCASGCGCSRTSASAAA